LLVDHVHVYQRATLHVSAVLAVGGCPSVRLSVCHTRVFIQTAKDGSPITLVF